MSQRAIRNWVWVHTAFLLMLCLTGMPLIFHHEIDELSGAPQLPVLAAGIPAVSGCSSPL